MTALAPPPAASELAPLPGGRRAANRAIRRWAWRLLRREWRQQLLVLCLLIVAVATTTVGLGLVVNVQGSDQAQLGTANTRLDISDPGSQANADLSAARNVFGIVEGIAHEQFSIPGSVSAIDLRAQDPKGGYGSVMVALVSGSYPVGAGQVAVTSQVAAELDLHVGGSWHVDGRVLRVVGIVENPQDSQDVFALVAPGQIAAPTALTLLLDDTGSEAIRWHPPSGTVQGVMTIGASATARQSAQALALLLIATIGLTFIGLLAAAGFTVMAQRRLRALGMMGAIGATDRQVRRVMLANGIAVGIVGAAAGTAIGLSAWFALRSAFEQLVGHRIDPLRLPWWAVTVGAGLAVLTALAASWWPARSAARIPIVAALSGRPAPPQPAHRFALLGIGLAGAGFALLVYARGQQQALIVLGILSTTAGMLLLAPLGIRALGAAGRRAPIAVRLALRDLARYQARSGAALAATSFAVGIAASIAISAAAQQAADQRLTGGNLPSNELIVWLSGNPNGSESTGGGGVRMAVPGSGDGAPAGPSEQAISNARAVAGSIARSLHAPFPLELETAVSAGSEPRAAGAPGAVSLAHTWTNADGNGWRFVTTPFVATPALLHFYGLSASNVPGDADVLSARDDLQGTQLGSEMSRSWHDVTVSVTKRLPNYTSAPNTVIAPREVAALGLTVKPAGWLIRSSQPLTPARIGDARDRAAAAGITIETRTAGDHSLQRLRDYATATGVLVALGVLAMTVGLIRSETAADLRTLSATGASGRTRRALTAATAGALGLLGGVIGTAGAYLALIAWHWRDIGHLSSPPYWNLAALLAGLPLVAVVGGWLASRTPRAISRRPLE